jgi:ribosomal-protein-alanine acetyltransferase
MIRDARPDDLAALIDLENRCFDSDRLSARSFRRLLRTSGDDFLVAVHADALAGYVLVFHRRNTSLARMYSVAVDPAARGLGLGEQLVLAAEERALARGSTRMRLEVRADNDAAQALYRKLGYRPFGTIENYYADHADALRMEKALAPNLARGLSRVPWYPQSLEFTCGPACLMMAMKALEPGTAMDRSLEIQLWREATTVYMTSGLGGCGAQGLALAAWRRGFEVRVSLSDATEIFTAGVRSEKKKEVIRLVEQDFARQLRTAGIRVSHRARSVSALRRELAAGAFAVVLISSYRLHGDRAPHWVLLTAADEHFLYINDPFVDREEQQTDTDCIGIPIAPVELERMMRLGRSKHHACLLIGQRGTWSNA